MYNYENESQLTLALKDRNYSLAEELISSGIEITSHDRLIAKAINDIPLSLASKIRKAKHTSASVSKARNGSMRLSESKKDVSGFNEIINKPPKSNNKGNITSEFAKKFVSSYTKNYQKKMNSNHNSNNNNDRRKEIYKSKSIIPKESKKEIKLKNELKLISSFYIIQYEDIEILKKEIIHYSDIATLYKGKYLHLPVCIKEYHLSSMTQSEINLLHSEITLSLSLSHPNIIKHLGICEEASSLYLISEYISNGSLKSNIDNNAITSIKEKIQILYEIALAVYYLHTRNPIVYHRDLKSSNVLLDQNRKAKLCDFGMARTGISNHRTNSTSTPYWMAPEFVLKGIFNEKSDVYSYGILMWEVFMEDTVPYKNENVYDFILGNEEALKKRPVIKEEMFDECKEMKVLMVNCWDSDIEKRPTIKEIVETIEKIKNKDN